MVSHSFGEWIRFDISLNPSLTYESVELVITPRGTNNSSVHPLVPDPQKRVQFEYKTSNYGAIRAFNYIDYYIVATLTNGEQRQSTSIEYEYIDSRFSWNSIISPPFKVSFYNADTTFGQKILDTALESIENTSRYIQLAPPSNIHIIVYQNSSDLREALRLSGLNWIAGQADPALGIAMVSIQPGPEEILEIERQLPHEITHLQLYQQYPERYEYIPSWLNEGLASLSEFYPNPEYQIILDSAHQDQALFPIANLCAGFPTDATGAAQAYSQAESFTRYLYDQYGSFGLTQIVEAYIEGHPCETAPQIAVGETLTRLERGWRETTFSEKPSLGALGNITGWLGLLLFALIGPILLILLNRRTS